MPKRRVTILAGALVFAAAMYAQAKGGLGGHGGGHHGGGGPNAIVLVNLSNGTNFTTPASPGVIIDTLTAICSTSCAGATFTLATTGACSGAASNGSFATSSGNLNIGGSTVTAGNYPIGIAVHLVGASNDGVCFPFTLAGADITPTISGVALSNGTAFTTPASPGTTIDTLTANCSVGSCAGATFALSTAGPCSGASSNSSFAIPGSNLNIGGGSTVNAGSYPIGIAVTLAGASNSGTCYPFTLIGTGGGSQTIAAVVLSNTATTTGLSSGTAVGTLSASMSPPTPVFSYVGANLHLSVSGGDSGGVCNGTNGANNGSFQVGSGDTLQTNGAITAGSKAICVAAAESGVAAVGQAFTVTVGNRIDAAAGVGTGGCTGSGTSGSPWNYHCIQNAINSAVSGDTVFLRGGNWALNTGDGAGVVGISGINLVGVGSGNVFDVWGHISNPAQVSGVTDPCPTSGSSITCVYGSGTSHGYPGASGDFAGTISFSSCTNDIVAHIFFDGSLTTAGGGQWGLLNFLNCTGPILINDIRFLAFNDSGISGETQFYMFQSSNYTVQNSVFADPIVSGGGTYNNAQTFQVNGEGNNVTIVNDVFYQGGPNPIYLSNVTHSTNQQYDYNDGIGNTAILPAMGVAGASLGGPSNVYCPEAGTTPNGLCLGDTHAFITDNLFYAPGHFFGTGAGINDASTSGGVNDLHWTGNWINADDAEIDVCAAGDCGPTTIVSATAASCTSGTLTFTAASTGINMGDRFYTLGFSPQGYNNGWTAATGNSSAVTVTGVTCPGAATTLGTLSPSTVVGMTISTQVDVNCVASQYGSYGFNVTNNSILGTSKAALDERNSGGTGCKLGNPWTGNYTTIPITTYGFNGQHNYLSSPSNQYLTNANLISPVQANNFCAGSGGAGTVTGCATSGFSTLPTVSFTLGTLGLGGIVPFTAPSFTAQYGAVQWLASTSSTPPNSSDARWSSNNSFWTAHPASFPPSAANSYIPPVSLSGVTHGNTVYLWVMDSANNISAVSSALVP